MPEIREAAEKADQIRKRHLYRRLILTGKLKLSRSSAVPLVGPDCAYHLYRRARVEQPDQRDE